MGGLRPGRAQPLSVLPPSPTGSLSHSPHKDALVSARAAHVKVGLAGDAKYMGWKVVSRLLRVAVVVAVRPQDLVRIDIDELVRVDRDERRGAERGVKNVEEVAVAEAGLGYCIADGLSTRTGNGRRWEKGTAGEGREGGDASARASLRWWIERRGNARYVRRWPRPRW